MNTWYPALASSRANSGEVPNGSNIYEHTSRLSAAHLVAIPSGIGGRNRERSPELSIGCPVMNGAPLIILAIHFYLNSFFNIIYPNLKSVVRNKLYQDEKWVYVWRLIRGTLFRFWLPRTKLEYDTISTNWQQGV